MRIPFQKTEAEKRSAAAKAALKSTTAKLAELDIGRAAALADPTAYAKWSADRSATASEIDRLSGLIDSIQTEAENAAKAAGEADTKRQLDAARKQAAELAERIKVDGQRIMGDLLLLARECARQSLAAKALNAIRPEGEPPIPVADILARDFGAEPRRDLRTRDISLWVAETTGEIIGDQGAVVSEDGVHGQVHILGGTMRWKCMKRAFRETEFHPSTAADWPGHLFQLIRLPRIDGPGPLFDGALSVVETVADLDVAALTSLQKRRARPTQVELVPLEPWQPVRMAGEASKNEAL